MIDSFRKRQLDAEHRLYRQLQRARMASPSVFCRISDFAQATPANQRTLSRLIKKERVAVRRYKSGVACGYSTTEAGDRWADLYDKLR